MKNITLSAEEKLIEAAREKARQEHTTLNAEFRRWLKDYTQNMDQVRKFEQVMRDLRGKVRVGKKLTRDEMNER